MYSDDKSSPVSFIVRITLSSEIFLVSAVHDDRKHVGIQNTERRIEAMCGGDLKVESTIGEGTTALISIPKEGVKCIKKVRMKGRLL